MSDTPSLMGGKHVKPEDAHVDHFFKHQGWDMLKRDGVVHAVCSFFNGVNETLHFGDMLMVHTNIETRSGTGQGST